MSNCGSRHAPTDVEAIGELSIQLFEASDAFRVFSAVGAVSGAEKIVKLTGGYETTEGGSFELEFRGSVSDAQPVKEFLEPQLRAASTKSIETVFQLTFAQGLSMLGRCGRENHRAACPIRQRSRLCIGRGEGRGLRWRNRT